MQLPPRFVQGFVDELERQKAQRRPEVNTGAPDHSGASAYAMTAPPGAARPPHGGGVNAGPLLPPANVPAYAPPRPPVRGPAVQPQVNAYQPRPVLDVQAQQMGVGQGPQPEAVHTASGETVQLAPPVLAQRPPEEVTPGMAGSTVDPFVTGQTTRTIVATSQGQRVGEELGGIASENQAARARLDANTAEHQALTEAALQPGHQSTQAELEREQELETQIAEDQATLDRNAARSRDLGSGSGVVGTLMGVVSAPGEWGGAKLGDLGYWYAAQQGDPGAAAAVLGFIANSPLGAVLSADGVGVTDYVRWIEDHPDEVAHVQANGYTNSSGQHFTGGDALYNYYLASLNLPQRVVTQGAVDPTSYVGLTGVLGRRLAGTAATRFLPEGAAGRRATVGGSVNAAVPEGALADAGVRAGMDATVAREGWSRGARRTLGGVVAAPQTVLDEAADRAVVGGLRAVRSVLPDSWFETPLGAQAAGIVQRIDNALRTEHVARRQMAEGERSAAPDPREADVAYDPTPPPDPAAAAPPYVPEAPVVPGSQYEVPLPGETVMLDQGAQPRWYPERPFASAAPAADPLALPPGEIVPPPPDAAAWSAPDPGAGPAPDVEAPTPPAPRYASPDDVPIRDNPNFRRGTGPAEVGEGDNLLVVDRTDDGKRWTIYGGDEYPNYPSRAAAITVARREVARLDAEAASGGVGREGPRVDALTGEDFVEVSELEDGSWGAFLPDDDVPLVTAATEADARAAVADLLDDDLPTGQTTLPTDPQTQWRQFGVGRPKMVDSVLDQADDYAARGLAPQVDRWLRWREEFVEELNVSRGTPSENTPSLQSVTDRAEEEIAFARIVGEAPPEQPPRFGPGDPPTVASMAEAALYGEDPSTARAWFRRTPNKKLTAQTAPEYGAEVRTYRQAADYLKWLRQKRDNAVSGMEDQQIELLGMNATVDLPSFAEMYRSVTGTRSTAKRLKRARLQEARARRRSPLPPGITRRPILSAADERLLTTRIADLGKVGRADVEAGGVVTPRARDAGDTATVRSVYDPAYEAALARGLSPDDAHAEGMKAVASRIEADFGLADQAGPNKFWRGVDTYTNYVTMMARYGTPIASARSIQTDMVGDFMQALLSEGPVTATQMVARSAGYVRRGFRWADTRAGEVAQSWGLDVRSLSPREGIVRSEVAGGGSRSAVRKVFGPRFGKVDLDPVGKVVAKPAEVGRKLNEQMEVGRRTALKLSIVDSALLREKRSFAGKVGTHRRLAQGAPIADDEIAATIADLGPRFGPEDVRLAMERLAASKGAKKEAAAAFGERVGRDWANVRNTAVEDASRRVNKALFSYEFTKADEVARRFVPFHYWTSRAIPFYVETAIRNPAFALAYYRMVEGLSERAEAEGWPASLKFMVKIWTGPMGYVFFADPAANMGLLGVAEMLYPNDFRDDSMSSVGRFLQAASGRGGAGVTPIITSLMGYAGLLGEDTYALDFTGTRPIRNLIGAVVQVAANEIGDPNLLGRPVDSLFMRGREIASRYASLWIPGAREIPTTDPQAYPKLQIRNAMIDMLMQERGYTSEAQLTEGDWEEINTQFETQDGPLYEEAVTDYGWANLVREGMRVLSGPVSARQEGQLARQVRDRRTPPGGSYAEPGQEPTAQQAYETYANLDGRYGRTAGGTSLPEYDPYADFQLTEGEVRFMELWYQETGERYEQGDLEALREGEDYARTMAQTTPAAAPYVAAEMGYYDLGPEAAAPLLDTYYGIMFADADVGMVVISGREWGPQRLSALTSDERETLADAWLQERDTDGSARRTLQMRDAWVDAHPEYARYREWRREVDRAWEDAGGIGAYRNALIAENPNAARYFEDAARAARQEVGSDASPQEYYAELDRRTTSLNAYLAINGIPRTLDDPRAASTGDPASVAGPADPRPPGWAAEGDGAGGGPSGGGAGGAGSDTGGSSRSRAEWATETIAATQSGVAQANALLTQQMGYPVDIAQLPGPTRDAALAMLPPGLIPEDAWLYFDYTAWQAHQRLSGGPEDLLSYLAATANGREWRARRSTFQAGGATLVGSTPAVPYTGAEAAPAADTRAIPGGSYAAYLAGA